MLTMKLQNLPLEIIITIISKLPVKSILRCKSLSTTFDNLISDPSFSHIYLTNNPFFNAIYLDDSICQNKSNPVSFDLVEFPRDIYNNSNQDINSATCLEEDLVVVRGISCDKISDGPSRVCGYCNGVFSFLQLHLDSYNVFVINPILGDFIQLPGGWSGSMAYGYGFGLGYCQFTNRYKVFRVVSRYPDSAKKKCEILTVGSDDKWRSVYVEDDDVPFNTQVIRSGRHTESSMVAFGSALHWLAAGDPFRSQLEPFRGYIRALDMTQEKVSALPLPPEAARSRYLSGDLRVLMEKLCLWGLTLEGFHMSIWIMDEYGVDGSWTKRITLLPQPGMWWWAMKPLAISAGVIVISNGSQLVYLDMKANQVLRNVKVFERDSYPMPFVPSFVSLRTVMKAGL